MTTRSISRIVGRRPRRSRQWGITNSNGSLVAATHAAQINLDLTASLEVALGFDLHNVTASAIRLNINYRLTTSSTGDENTVACGVGWVSNRARDAGGVALPDPSVDNFDWMFHDIRTLSSSRDVVDIDEQVPGSMLVIRNDSMRKQHENASSLLIIFRASLLQSVAIQVFIGGRVLFLLP